MSFSFIELRIKQIPGDIPMAAKTVTNQHNLMIVMYGSNLATLKNNQCLPLGLILLGRTN